MSDLNQYAISKILGSEMKPVKGGRFGGFGTLTTTAEALKALREAEHESLPVKFTRDQDRLVARAFEDVREGASIDALLWDKDLARRFMERCRALKLTLPAAALVLRLMRIRKDPRLLARYGIKLSPTTRSDPHLSIVAQYAHVIEFALVRLRYRYGAASIDIILADPELGERFEQVAHAVAPNLTSIQLRLGALYIRKIRHFAKRKAEGAQVLDPGVVEKAMTPPVSLAKINPDEVPAGHSLLELREHDRLGKHDRFLYVAHNENLRSAVEQLKTGHAFEILADGFWQPVLENITLRYVEGHKVGGVRTAQWERRLIQAREPVFNWPMTKKDAAA
jgi:hypothetical protein